MFVHKSILPVLLHQCYTKVYQTNNVFVINLVSGKPYTLDVSQELNGKIISVQVEAHKNQ